MSIFTRLSDIVNSNISALLDKAENPEKMIRMVIQEMEETLVEVRSTTAKVIADKKTLKRRVDTLQKQSHDWEQKAELALSKGREDLAKAALVERSAINSSVAITETKLNDARARQKTILLRTKATQSRLSVHDKLKSHTIDSALNKFEHFERKIDQMEGQLETGHVEQRGLQSEFEELERQEQIDAELAALKAKMAKSAANAAEQP